MTTKTINLVEALAHERDHGVLIWLFNIGAEQVWHPSPRKGGMVDRDEQQVVNRMEEMNLLLCRSQDVIILREQPDEAFLDMLQRLGFSLPRIEVPEPSDPLTPISELVLADDALLARLRTVADAGHSSRGAKAWLVPYAVTPQEEAIAERCGLELIGAPSAVCAQVNDKIFSRLTAQKLGFAVSEGAVCADEAAIRRECERLAGLSDGPVKLIIKQPHGASGQGMYMLDELSKLDTLLSVMRRFGGSSSSSGGWLVERWHNKQMDLNYQLCIDEGGGVTMFSLKRQNVDGTVYIGSQVPADIGETLEEEVRRCAYQLGTYLYSIGYTGMASIDGFVDEDGLLVPVIEINGRFTLSTYISFLSSVLGEQHKTLSRYYRNVTATPLTYSRLCGLLADEGLLYTPERPEGVFVYTAGTLSGIPVKRGYVNRIFTLILADSWQEADAYAHKLEGIIAGLGCS